MCTHALAGDQNDDRLLGMEECKSPFGTYELKIPVDETLACTDDLLFANNNCRDLDVSFHNYNQVHLYLKSKLNVNGLRFGCSLVDSP